eukprot:COSAG02_NODE_86_length_39084_cov_17.815724_4_plen_58_part_00
MQYANQGEEQLRSHRIHDIIVTWLQNENVHAMHKTYQNRLLLRFHGVQTFTKRMVHF